jgi:hypothetical protein
MALLNFYFSMPFFIKIAQKDFFLFKKKHENCHFFYQKTTLNPTTTRD